MRGGTLQHPPPPAGGRGGSRRFPAQSLQQVPRLGSSKSRPTPRLPVECLWKLKAALHSHSRAAPFRSSLLLPRYSVTFPTTNESALAPPPSSRGPAATSTSTRPLRLRHSRDHRPLPQPRITPPVPPSSRELGVQRIKVTPESSRLSREAQK